MHMLPVVGTVTNKPSNLSNRKNASCEMCRCCDVMSGFIFIHAFLLGSEPKFSFIPPPGVVLELFIKPKLIVCKYSYNQI